VKLKNLCGYYESSKLIFIGAAIRDSGETAPCPSLTSSKLCINATATVSYWA